MLSQISVVAVLRTECHLESLEKKGVEEFVFFFFFCSDLGKSSNNFTAMMALEVLCITRQCQNICKYHVCSDSYDSRECSGRSQVWKDTVSRQQDTWFRGQLESLLQGSRSS